MKRYLLFVVVLLCIWMIDASKISFAEETVKQSAHLVRAAIEGRVTIIGGEAIFRLGGDTAKSMFFQMDSKPEKVFIIEDVESERKFASGVLCTKYLPDPWGKRLYQCQLGLNLKEGGMTMETPITEHSCEQYDDPLPYVMYWRSIWDTKGNKRPRAPNAKEFGDALAQKRDALDKNNQYSYEEKETLLREYKRKLLIDAAKLPGFDLMVAIPEGDVTIAKGAARFCFVGKTAEAIYHHSEGKKHTGIGCRTISPAKLPEQYYCWMTINLKRNEGLVDMDGSNYCQPEVQ